MHSIQTMSHHHCQTISIVSETFVRFSAIQTFVTTVRNTSSSSRNALFRSIHIERRLEFRSIVLVSLHFFLSFFLYLFIYFSSDSHLYSSSSPPHLLSLSISMYSPFFIPISLFPTLSHHILLSSSLLLFFSSSLILFLHSPYQIRTPSML